MNASERVRIAGYNGERLRMKKMNIAHIDYEYGCVVTHQYDITFDNLIKLVYNWFDEKDLHDPVMQMVKVQEEIGELAHEVTRSNFKSLEIIDAIGDSFVTLIGMCHHLHIDPTFALYSAYDEIRDRKGKIINNSFVKEEKNEESSEV